MHISVKISDTFAINDLCFFSGPYFLAFGPRYVHISSKGGKIGTRKNSVFGHFLHSAAIDQIEILKGFKSVLQGPAFQVL